jgi:MFS family permease
LGKRLLLPPASAALSIVSLVFLDSLGLTVALGRIGRSMNLSTTALEWTVIAYSLTFAVMLRTGCALRAMFGPRRMFAVGQGALAAFSVLCALAPDGAVLIAGRVGQGLAAALIVPAALTGLSQAFPSRFNSALPGFTGGAAEWGAAFGPIVCTAAAQVLGWRGIFWLNVPLCAAALLLAPPDWSDRTPTRPLDPAGTALFAAGSLGLVWGLTAGGGLGWGDRKVIAALVAGTVLLAWHAGGKVPLALFRIKEFAGTRASYSLAYAALFATMLLLPLYVCAPAAGPADTLERLAPWSAGLLVCVPLSEPLGRRIGPGRLVAGGLGAAACGLVLFAHGIDGAWSSPRLGLPLCLASCGIAAALPAARSLTAAARAHLKTDTPDSLGALRYFGGTVGFAVVGAVLGVGGITGRPAQSSAGFARALDSAAALCVAAALAALLATVDLRFGEPRSGRPPAVPRLRPTGDGALPGHMIERTVTDRPPRTRSESIGSATTG